MPNHTTIEPNDIAEYRWEGADEEPAPPSEPEISLRDIRSAIREQRTMAAERAPDGIKPWQVRCHRHGATQSLEIRGEGRRLKYCCECFQEFMSESGLRNHDAPMENTDGDQEYVY